MRKVILSITVLTVLMSGFLHPAPPVVFSMFPGFCVKWKTGVGEILAKK
jgi:hypothetical protein